jgi:hypothetical protein
MGTALSGSYLAFSASPTLPIAAGLALAVLAEIASSVPIPPNIDIVVRLLLLLLVTSKNKINDLLRITVGGLYSKKSGLKIELI